MRNAQSFGHEFAGDKQFYFTAVLPGSQGGPCELSAAFWPELVRTLLEVNVVVRAAPAVASVSVGAAATAATAHSQGS